MPNAIPEFLAALKELNQELRPSSVSTIFERPLQTIQPLLESLRKAAEAEEAARPPLNLLASIADTQSQATAAEAQAAASVRSMETRYEQTLRELNDRIAEKRENLGELKAQTTEDAINGALGKFQLNLSLQHQADLVQQEIDKLKPCCGCMCLLSCNSDYHRAVAKHDEIEGRLGLLTAPEGNIQLKKTAAEAQLAAEIQQLTAELTAHQKTAPHELQEAEAAEEQSAAKSEILDGKLERFRQLYAGAISNELMFLCVRVYGYVMAYAEEGEARQHSAASVSTPLLPSALAIKTERFRSAFNALWCPFTSGSWNGNHFYNQWALLKSFEQSGLLMAEVDRELRARIIQFVEGRFIHHPQHERRFEHLRTPSLDPSATQASLVPARQAA